jgi:diaminopimelate epimerase
MTKFIKMNGLGNDFVIIDRRNQKFEITPAIAKWIGYRRFGVGCDQVILLDTSDKADIYMGIYNSDGSQSNACGNATRCVAKLMIDELRKDQVTIETKVAVLTAVQNSAGLITVDMGEPSFDWRKIPLSEELDVLNLPLEVGPLKNPAAVSMGNPHIVFFLDDISKVKLRNYGPTLENHAMFPERTNVSLVQVMPNQELRVKVWERGVGKTLACGTAACASLVTAIALEKITIAKTTVELPGGKLEIEWNEAGRVLMSGPVAKVFEAELFADAFRAK